MPEVPNNEPNNYVKIVNNLKQARRKLKPLTNEYIDATNNKQLFKEMRDVMIDILQMFKTAYGVQRDDDTDI
jgi:hypothetical protein